MLSDLKEHGKSLSTRRQDLCSASEGTEDEDSLKIENKYGKPSRSVEPVQRKQKRGAKEERRTLIGCLRNGMADVKSLRHTAPNIMTSAFRDLYLPQPQRAL